MILITFIMFVAALFGGIPKVTRSFEVLIVHRALAGLHCGMFLLASNLSMVNNIGTIHAYCNIINTCTVELFIIMITPEIQVKLTANMIAVLWIFDKSKTPI